MADRIKLNSPGIRALLSSTEMRSALCREAMGAGQIVRTYITGDRYSVLTKKGKSNADRGKGNSSPER